MFDNTPVELDTEYMYPFDDFRKDYVLYAFLWTRCKQRRPLRILEFGTNEGHSAAVMHMASPDSEITTIDRDVKKCVFPDTEKIIVVHADSRGYKPEGKFDLILVDGGHDWQTCMADSLNALSCIAEGGIIIWDDYEPQSGANEVNQVLYELAKTHNIKFYRSDSGNYIGGLAWLQF